MDEEEQDVSNQQQWFSRSLLNYWYPITFSGDLKKDETYSICLFGEPLVLFRSSTGQVQCLEDRCSHRSTPLSYGAIENGQIECRYHGWRFGEGGKCTRVPSFEEDRKIPDYYRVPSHPAKERDGFIWVWPGDPDEMDEYFPGPPPERIKDLKMIEQKWDSNYPFEIMMENALDPAHIQFVHEGKQGKVVGPRNKNYPEGVGSSMEIENLLNGFQSSIQTNSTTTPMDHKIAFFYPNYTHLERIVQPQMYICTWVVPMTRYTSRLIFRFYRSFVKWIPDLFFYGGNDIIAKQDQVVLTGQQIRIEQGASRWNIPVKADILGVTFRRWWDKVNHEQTVWFGTFDSTMKNPSVRRIKLVDIEDLPRKNVHPCVSSHIEIQQNYDDKVKKLYPTLWPQQYGRRRAFARRALTVTAVAVAVCALVLVNLMKE